ncbi:MAG: pitrilysin family protein [bacterium]
MNTKNFDPYDFSKKEIDGVPVYYKNLPWAPCIHIRIVFNTCAFDDPVGKEGLSHFLEHMIFDGSPMLSDKKAIKEWSKLYALDSWNAWTGFDCTCYWLKCLPEEYTRVLLGMKDMIFNSFCRPEDIEHERKIITQEAWNRLQNEKFLKYIKNTADNLYHGHNRARFNTAVGWPDTIAKISEDDIKSWRKANYGIGNFFIVLAGAVEEKHIEDLKEFLKNLPKVSKITREEGLLGKPKQKRFITTADEIGEIKEQVEISIVRVSEKRPQSEDEIINLSGKLLRDLSFERLRMEHGLCYGVDIGTWRMKTFFQLSMNVKTEEKNVELVEKEFKNIVDEIVEGKHTEKFNLIKKMYIDQLKSNEKLSANIVDGTLREIVIFGDHITTLEEQLADAERVTYADVIKFVKWANDPEYVYTEIILPSKK